MLASWVGKPVRVRPHRVFGVKADKKKKKCPSGQDRCWIEEMLSSNAAKRPVVFFFYE